MKKYAVTHRGQASKEKADNAVITPDWLIDIMIDWAQIGSGMNVLEPAYGDGAILDKLASYDIELYGFELYPYVRWSKKPVDVSQPVWLAGKKPANSQLKTASDFLKNQSPIDWKADVCIMNPPFSDKGVWKFVRWAIDEWMKPDGKVITVSPNYIIDNAEGRKSWFSKHLRRVGNVPKNTFKPVVPVLHGSLLEFSVQESDAKASYEFLHP